MSIRSQEVFVETLLRDYARAEYGMIYEHSGSITHALEELRRDLFHRSVVWKALTGQQIHLNSILRDVGLDELPEEDE